MQPVQSLRALPSEGPHPWLNAILKFLIIFQHRDLCFNFAMGPPILCNWSWQYYSQGDELKKLKTKFFCPACSQTNWVVWCPKKKALGGFLIPTAPEELAAICYTKKVLSKCLSGWAEYLDWISWLDLAVERSLLVTGVKNDRTGGREERMFTTLPARMDGTEFRWQQDWNLSHKTKL